MSLSLHRNRKATSLLMMGEDNPHLILRLVRDDTLLMVKESLQWMWSWLRPSPV